MSASFPDPLLVSSVNGGGVFLVDAGTVERWSKVDTTGIALFPDGVLLARQVEGRAELRRLRGREVHRIQIVDRSLDLHDVRWQGNRILVVATRINTVFEFDEMFAELRHWSFPGEEDSQHINSVCLHQGRLLASRFGRFQRHRGYKDRTRGAGEIFDIETGETLISELSQPHSLVSRGDALWVCDSEARMLRRYRGFACDVEYPLDGYPRGLAFGGDIAYVGLSRSRNAEIGSLPSACIVAVDLRCLAEVARIDVPADEIYDIRVLDAETIPGLRIAALADAVAEYDTLVDARNRAVADVIRENENASDVASSLHRANLRIGVLEADNARMSAAHAAAARRDREHDTRHHEDVYWAGLLDAEVDRLRGIISSQSDALKLSVLERNRLREAVRGYEQAIASERALIEAQRSHMLKVESSRSWRWTRWLRKEEPHAPDVVFAALPDPVAETPDVASPPSESLSKASPSALASEEGWPGPRPTRAAVPIFGLSFESPDAPVISILVTAYGHFVRTRACMESIRDAGAALPYEVILVEDHSADREMDRFGSVPGLRYRRNAENLGFLHSVNAALDMVRGEFVCLLNNDTLVTPGWLDALLRTFRVFGDCGMAGSRLVYPDGRLQEAGGIVWSDADACNIGRGLDPSDIAYAAVRDVDYVSGASVLLRTATFRALGGFDARYAPAYYEDTDLAFRLREEGLKTYYQPASVVIHDEGMSHGVDVAVGAKSCQARNREIFHSRWRERLETGQLDAGEHPFLARSRVQLKKTVLVVDRYSPRTDQDAGSRAIWHLIQVLHLFGFHVMFWPWETEDDLCYRANLQAHGVDVLAEGDADFESWISSHGIYLDYVVLSRPSVAAASIDAVRRHSEARILYYGHDIHHLRLERQLALSGDTLLAAQIDRVRSLERSVWGKSDLVLYPTDEETRHVRAWAGQHASGIAVATIPLFAYQSLHSVQAGPEARDEVLFVGNYEHAPNEDGAFWFANEVWPLVIASCPELRLCLAGAHPSERIRTLASNTIVVPGQLSEDALAARYDAARVAVAPLRFGAGLKGKVLEAMRFGVPCVATSAGAQGFAGFDELRVADEAAMMASAVVALARDDESWLRASQAGQTHLRENFSVDAVWATLRTIMDREPYADVAARRNVLQGNRDSIERRRRRDPS